MFGYGSDFRARYGEEYAPPRPPASRRSPRRPQYGPPPGPPRPYDDAVEPKRYGRSFEAEGGRRRGRDSARRPARGYRAQSESYRGRASTTRDRSARGDVDRVRVADIMTSNPEAVTPETPLKAVAERMRELDVGVVPVVEDEDGYRLLGVVTDRDIAVRAAAEGKDMRKTTAREIMSKGPQTVREDAHVRDVINVMKRARVRRVPVVSVDGRLVGIVAQADLAVNYAGLDLQRETEIEEVIERISEPARPRWGREGEAVDRRARGVGRFTSDLALELPDRMRSGWRALTREARDLIGRRYDRRYR